MLRHWLNVFLASPLLIDNNQHRDPNTLQRKSRKTLRLRKQAQIHRRLFRPSFLPSSHSRRPPAETPPSSVAETTECYEGRGQGYRGAMDVTPTGIACQRWDSQYPHNHTFLPQAYPCKWVTKEKRSRARERKTTKHALAQPPTCMHLQQITGWLSLLCRDLRENFCRNPDGQEFPWCFTTDPRVRTMFCTNIPQCGTESRASGEKLDSFEGPRCYIFFKGADGSKNVVFWPLWMDTLKKKW